MIELTRKAKIALETLDAKDRKRIQRALETIDRFPEDESSRRNIHKLTLPGKIYVSRAGHEWRIIFELSVKAKLILDIVRYDRLERFHKALSEGGNHESV